MVKTGQNLSSFRSLLYRSFVYNFDYILYFVVHIKLTRDTKGVEVKIIFVASITQNLSTKSNIDIIVYFCLLSEFQFPDSGES